MADGGDGGGVDEGGAGAADQAEDDDEVPVLGAGAEQEGGEQDETGADCDQDTGTMDIEDGTDLDAAEEG